MADNLRALAAASSINRRCREAAAVLRVCLAVAFHNLFLVTYASCPDVLSCCSSLAVRIRYKERERSVRDWNAAIPRAHNRRASRELSERTLSTIPTKERCSCKQWRESRLAPRRRRMHGVDDTSVSDPCGMVFTSRVRIYRPRYDDGAASRSTDLGREPRREPPWGASAVSFHIVAISTASRTRCHVPCPRLGFFSADGNCVLVCFRLSPFRISTLVCKSRLCYSVNLLNLQYALCIPVGRPIY